MTSSVPSIAKFAIKSPYQAMIRVTSVIIVLVSLVFSICIYHYGQTEDVIEYKENTAKEKTDKELAIYTLWLTLFTGALAISTIGLWLTTRQGMRDQSRDMRRSVRFLEEAAKASRDAADIASQTLLAAHRPWIKISDIALADGLQFTNEGFAVPISLVLENIGSSPALEVEVQIWPLARGMPFGVLEEHGRRVAAAHHTNRPKRILFPSERFPHNGSNFTYSAMVAFDEIPDALPPHGDWIPEEFRYTHKYFDLYIGGCVIYSTGIRGDRELKRTSFFFSILKKGWPSGFQMQSGITFALEDIILMRSPMGDGRIAT